MDLKGCDGLHCRFSDKHYRSFCQVQSVLVWTVGEDRVEGFFGRWKALHGSNPLIALYWQFYTLHINAVQKQKNVCLLMAFFRLQFGSTDSKDRYLAAHFLSFRKSCLQRFTELINYGAINIKYYECVSVFLTWLSIIQCACAVLCCHLWPSLALSKFSTLSYLRHDFRQKKMYWT